VTAPHASPWKLFNIVMRLAGLFTILAGAVFLSWSILLIVRAPILAWAHGVLADPDLAAPLLFAAVWFSIVGVGILRAPAYRPDLGDADRLVDPLGFKLRRVFPPSRSWWTGDRTIGTRRDDPDARLGRSVQPGRRPNTPVTWEPLSRFRKGVVLTMWTLGMVSLLCKSYLYLDYGARMPHAPQQETGRVHPFIFKNSTVYVTEAEQARFSAASWMFLGSFVGFGLCLIIWGGSSVRRAA
jgi:hypothetical protein